MASIIDDKELALDIDDEEKRLDTSQLNTTSPSSPVESNQQLELNSSYHEPEPDDFTVKWEENDPLNPRTRYSYARKWLITVIITTSGVCVYVHRLILSILNGTDISLYLKHNCIYTLHANLRSNNSSIQYIKRSRNYRSLIIRVRPRSRANGLGPTVRGKSLKRRIVERLIASKY